MFSTNYETIPSSGIFAPFKWAGTKINQAIKEITHSILSSDEDETLGEKGEKRFILHGLPVSVITSTVVAGLFACAHPLTGAIYGTIHYAAMTALSEASTHLPTIFHSNSEIEAGIKTGIGTALSYAITTAFINNVWRVPLNYQNSLILTIASLAGQLWRIKLIYRENNPI